MLRFLSGIGLQIVLAGTSLAGIAIGQAVPTQSVVSPSPLTTVSTPSIQPVTSKPEMALDPASLLPDLPPLPPAKASLIGGTIGKLDRVRDEITVQVFGGGKMKIAFDPRTRIYDDGNQASVSALQKGDRVYVDTILDGSTVFARVIRLKTTGASGESQGVVTSYRADKGELEIRDSLSPRVLKIRISPQTKVMHGDQQVSASDLVPGTLVAIKFGPQRGGGDVAEELSVLAVPGSSFTFAGRVVSLDLSQGLLVLDSSTDHKTYEIHFDPSQLALSDQLRESSDVTVVTQYDGSQYKAQTLTVTSPAQQ